MAEDSAKLDDLEMKQTFYREKNQSLHYILDSVEHSVEHQDETHLWLHVALLVVTPKGRKRHVDCG